MSKTTRNSTRDDTVSTAAAGDARSDTDTPSSDGRSSESDDPEPYRATDRSAEIFRIRLHAEAPQAIDVDWIEARMLDIVQEAGWRVDDVSVLLVSEGAMRAAHQRHCGDSSATDVLTFDLSEPRGSIRADVLACVDIAQRRAMERGWSVERELLLYVLHGLLHCLGYDDHDEVSFKRMHEEEDRLLTRIGVGVTFGIADESPFHAGDSPQERRDEESNP